MSSQQLLSFPNQILLSSEVEGGEHLGASAAHSPPKRWVPCALERVPSGSQLLAGLGGGGARSLPSQVLGVSTLFSGIQALVDCDCLCIKICAFSELLAVTCIWVLLCTAATWLGNLAIALFFL